ncbi:MULTISPECIES: ATP-grasp domain-containing protein [Paraburkholderia]|uniref:ATP-grasp domain-containing protein n=1 Tax=Paraburkholderia TaxID=1822464 RepID=UPI0008419EAD|nr:ATP-grasp domain-containing protein [Paraburkholderia nodosa]
MLAVTEKILGPEPYFVEMGHVVDATLDERDPARLSAYVETVARQIGLTLGVFHAEVRMTRDGPTLIEIAVRLGGDRIYRLVELAKSISITVNATRRPVLPMFLLDTRLPVVAERLPMSELRIAAQKPQ